jgi:hypothetical protein
MDKSKKEQRELSKKEQRAVWREQQALYAGMPRLHRIMLSVHNIERLGLLEGINEPAWQQGLDLLRKVIQERTKEV